MGIQQVLLEMCFDKECTSKRSLVQSRLWKDMGILPYKRLLLPIAVGDVNF